MARRDPYFDNAKFLAVLLVAAGHSWEPLRGSRVVLTTWTFVYLFHMPVFIFLAGYFARGFDASPRRLRRLVTSVLVPYVIFEAAYTIAAWRFSTRPLALSYFDPYFLTWFLLALFFWRLSAPLLRTLRHPVLITTGLAVLIGLTQDVPPIVMRAVTLLPFFALGLTVRPEHVARLRGVRLRAVAIVLLGLGFLAAYLALPHGRYQWVFWEEDYRALRVSPAAGMAIRLALLVTGAVLSAAFLTLVPRRATWFSTLGTRTLYAFLLHGFFVKWADWGHVYPQLGAAAWPVATLGAVAVATLLMTTPVRRLTHWAVEPSLPWLFREEPTASVGADPYPADTADLSPAHSGEHRG